MPQLKDSPTASKEIRLSEVIPLMQEVHRSNGKFVPNIGIPSAIKRKEELIIERAMEHCGFKTVMACVLGIIQVLFLFVFVFPVAGFCFSLCLFFLFFFFRSKGYTFLFLGHDNVLVFWRVYLQMSYISNTTLKIQI